MCDIHVGGSALSPPQLRFATVVVVRLCLRLNIGIHDVVMNQYLLSKMIRKLGEKGGGEKGKGGRNF